MSTREFLGYVVQGILMGAGLGVLPLISMWIPRWLSQLFKPGS